MNTHSYSLQLAAFLNSGQIVHLLDQSHALLMVLNSERRIIYCTHPVLELAQAASLAAVLGKRPGEMLCCVNAAEGGCGLSAGCCDCGALLASTSGLNGLPAHLECALTFEASDRLGGRIFDIRAIPLRVNGENLVALSLLDIGAEKRRRALEQVFLHDLMNTIGAIRGIMHFLRSDLQGQGRELLESVLPYFDLCVDEVAAQQKLLAAESRELVIRPERFSLRGMLGDLLQIYGQHALGAGKTLHLDFQSEAEEMISDRTIVHRICVNLLKNALEATRSGDTVGVSARDEDGYWHLAFSNPGVMPEEVRRNLFRRSFSTKGAGRGLGTQSVQLLCSNHLRGSVWFESTPETGTIFHVRIPQIHP